MNRIAVPGFISILVIFAFLGPQPAAAQSGGGAVVGISGPGVQWKPKLEINREPIPTLRLATELVEILPGETRRLAFDSGEDTGGSLTAFPGPYALVAGGTASGSLGMKAGVPIHYSLKVVQLDKDGLVLDIKISDKSKTVLATRTLALKNYDEALIEFASTANGARRLALRFLPTIVPIPPVQDYPALVPSLTLSGLLIRNGYELICRGSSTRGTVDDLGGTKIQFFTFHSERMGFLVMSYRPFPGARVAGYFEDKKLIFEWNGDIYEYFSLDKPFMPEGRWAAWFWEAGPSSGSGIGIGGFEADPNTGEFTDRVNQMMQMIERMRQARK